VIASIAHGRVGYWHQKEKGSLLADYHLRKLPFS
jgi:hypothetical protein